jgi:hypothetical protein
MANEASDFGGSGLASWRHCGLRKLAGFTVTEGYGRTEIRAEIEEYGVSFDDWVPSRSPIRDLPDSLY